MKKPARKPRPLKKADREVLDSLTIGEYKKGTIQEILEDIRREIVQDRNERRLDMQNPWKDGLEGSAAWEPWGVINGSSAWETWGTNGDSIRNTSKSSKTSMHPSDTPESTPWIPGWFHPTDTIRQLRKEVDSLQEQLNDARRTDRIHSACIWIAVALNAAAILVLNYTR